MEVTIERILPGGLGLAHAEGRTVMVPLAAPGDRLRVQIDRVKGNVSFGRIEEIITPSPDRVEPPCPYFGRCGGCDFQQITYQAQLDAKCEIIRDCLRRIAGIENIPVFQITPAPNPWHYRSRAQWQYDRIRGRLGYYESNSRRVCDVAECAVLVPELQETLTALRQQMEHSELPDDARDFRAVVGDEGVSISPALASRRNPSSRPRLELPLPLGEGRGEGLGNEQPQLAPLPRPFSQREKGDPTVREGSDSSAADVTRTIRGETYGFNAESFFQANNDLLPQLIDAAIGEASGETALELYCGVGLFTIPLARRFKHVKGVEADPAAAGFAATNLADADLANAEVSNQDVSTWLERDADEWLGNCAERGKLDYLLLDPPRTGAESRVINGIIRLKPQRLCYVSCDPATLARDLKKLIAGAYTLNSISAFDMFPQTHHVETIVHLGS